MPIRRPRTASATTSRNHCAEVLEVRVLPTVTATLSRGVLTLQGDQTANNLRIEQGAEGLLITGESGTLIRWNGQETASVEIVGVENVRGTFGKGSDAIRFEESVVLNNVTLNLGAGSNDVEFRDSTFNGLVSITGGNNGDKVEFDGATLNTITLNLVNGNDDVEFHGSTINGAVSVSTGNGIDNVRVDLGTGGVASTFAGAVAIKTGNQADKIELRDVTFANLSVDAGADNDEIELETVTVNGRLDVNGGSGADEISLSEVIQTGTGLNSIQGLSGRDVVLINGATFASAVSLNMGSGPMNELELDDVEFQAAVSIFSNGPNDRLRIEQDEAATGRTDFLAALSIQMGPGSTIDLGIDHDSSFTQSFGSVEVKGTKPNLLINIVEEQVNFTQVPVLKNAEFVIVPVTP